MRRAMVLGAVVLVGLLAGLPPALAHEGEDLPAKTLVKQAIALLRGQPKQVQAIEDKIHDALEAEDTKGVDLQLVRESEQAFEAGNRHRAWDLLEEAIGAAPPRVVVEPNEEPGAPAPPAPAEETSPAPPASAEEPSPVLHEQERAGSAQRPEGPAMSILLALAAVAGLAGLALAWRAR